MSGTTLIHSIFNLIQGSQIHLFPLRKELRQYKRRYIKPDIKAGFNVALLAFPQGMAYAAIAGLPIEYGIYGSAIASIIGALFGSSRFIILGPTNATSVMIFAAFLSLGVSAEEKLLMLPLALTLSGLFLIAGSFLRVANLIQFVSRSVITGYITAAAAYIILNQSKKILGIDFDIPQGSTFFNVVHLTLVNAIDAHLPTLVLSGITAITYAMMHRFFKTLPNVGITLVGMSLLASVINPFFMTRGFDGIELLNPIDASKWYFTVPAFEFEWLSILANAALIMAFLSVLEGASIGKSIAARAGAKLNTNQAMYSTGMANLACAFYSGMPASGSLTRSQLNWNSGSMSSMSSIIAGLLSTIGAYILGPFTRYIPSCVLAVLVIFIGLSLINKHHIRVVTKSTPSDAAVFLVTFLAALLVRLDFAIILGTATSIILFLRKAAVPELVEYEQNDGGEFTPRQEEKKRDTISIVHVEGDLFFGAAEIFQDQMRRVVEDPNLKIVILKLRNAHHLDATSVMALEELIQYVREQDRHLLVTEVRAATIETFNNSGLSKIIGEENLFEDDTNNPTLATAKALKRSSKLIGPQADVNIYLGTEKHQNKAKKRS